MNKTSILIRPVTLHDAKMLFEWRNDAETRQQSRTRDLVTWEGHIAWLENSLKNPRRVLCVAEIEGIPIGTVRADDRDDGYTEISYTVAPDGRGKGYSKPMVLRFVEEKLLGKKIVADIKKNHVPSESVALALGLKPFSETPSDDPQDARPMVEWR